MLKLILAVVALGLSVSCANIFLSPPLSGRVIDEAGNPVAGAFVVVAWLERHYSGSACRYVSGTRTDDHGRFTIIDWKGRNSGSVDEYIARYYSPGLAVSENRGGEILLIKNRLPRDERVSALQTIAAAITCGEQPGSKSVVAPMFLEIARELDDIGGEDAKAIASNYRKMASSVERRTILNDSASSRARTQ